MKQIGPNKYIGDPSLIAEFKYAKKHWDRNAKELELKLAGMTPVEGFWYLARREWNRPLSTRYPNYFRLESYGLIEFDTVEQKDYLDIEDVDKFVINLRSLYVVDYYQGQGYGSKIIDKVKDLADKVGCCVVLYVHPFAFTKDGTYSLGFTNWDELLSASLVEELDIIYNPEFEMDSIASFYKQTGFKNICFMSINDEFKIVQRKDADMFFYIYIPDSAQQEHKNKLANRLNIEMCEFCK
tara:strand:- start:197 stop:916 length:720 start_codon:yes stop_codon:yes gene_type:complete